MTDTQAQAPERARALINFPTGSDVATEYADAESLTATDVDDAALASIGELTGLIELTLMGTFSDEGLAALSGLTKLEQLTIVSPNFCGPGIRNLSGATGLQGLRVHQANLTPKGARACSAAFPSVRHLHLDANTLGIDHVLMLRPSENLETLSVQGGGDFLGGGDGEIDRVTAVEFISRCKNLQRFDARWSNRNSMLGDLTIVAMLQAQPGVTINGTWFDASVFGGIEAPEGAATTTAGESGQVVDLTDDNFDAAVGQVPVALVQFWSSNPHMCKAVVVEEGGVSQSLDQIASALAGHATVARLDSHTSPELAEKHNDVRAGGSLVVFSYGKVVGYLGATNPTGILTQLTPVLATS